MRNNHANQMHNNHTNQIHNNKDNQQFKSGFSLFFIDSFGFPSKSSLCIVNSHEDHRTKIGREFETSPIAVSTTRRISIDSKTPRNRPQQRRVVKTNQSNVDTTLDDVLDVLHDSERFRSIAEFGAENFENRMQNPRKVTKLV